MNILRLLFRFTGRALGIGAALAGMARLEAAAAKPMPFKPEWVVGKGQAGFGVLRVAKNNEGSSYLVGEFSAQGVLNGEGVEVAFYSPGVNLKTREVDFLMLVNFGLPSLAEILKLKPQIVKHGTFRAGQLEGKGTLYAQDVLQLPPLAWIAACAQRWTGLTAAAELRYTGEFKQNVPAGFGRAEWQSGTTVVACTGERLTDATNPDVVLEMSNASWKHKGIFRGATREGVLHGWAVSNVVRGQLSEGAQLQRQYWNFGYLELQGTAGAYPADELGAVTHRPDPQNEYVAQLDEKGAPGGFGLWRRLDAKGSAISTYRGYLRAGKPHGIGVTTDANRTTRMGTYDNGQLASGLTIDLFHEFVVIRGHDFGDRTHPVAGKLTAYRELKNYQADPSRFLREFTGDFAPTGAYLAGTEVAKIEGGQIRENYRNGRVESRSGSMTLGSLTARDVVTVDGISSPVVKNDHVGVTLADGRTFQHGKIASLGLSNRPLADFQHKCATCNGSGKIVQQHTVPDLTTYTTETRTTFTDASAVSGYWTTTSRVLVPTVHRGYTYNTYSPCNGCNSRGNYLGVKSLPEG